MSSIEELQMKIAKQKAELKRLKQNEKNKVSKKELDAFKNFFDKTRSNPKYIYYKFINNVYNNVYILKDDIRYQFSTIEDVEKARQFITFIEPKWNIYFLEAIKELEEELEEGLEEEEDD
jgi:hypothetical protein